MRNVTVVSFPAAFSMIIAAATIFIMNLTGLIPGQIKMGDYVVSLASLAVTMAAFMCVVFISLPKNKVRLLTVFIAAVLAVISAAVDFTYLNGYLLDVELPETVMDLVYVLIAVAISWLVNIIARKLFRILDNAYGDKFESYMAQTTSNFKDLAKNIASKTKSAFSKK